MEGYVLVTIKGQVAEVRDIFSCGSREADYDLLVGLVGHCRDLGLQRVSMVALEGNPAFDAATRLGFVSRPGFSTMFCYTTDDSPILQKLHRSEDWYVTVGDRDV